VDLAIHRVTRSCYGGHRQGVATFYRRVAGLNFSITCDNFAFWSFVPGVRFEQKWEVVGDIPEGISVHP
jgi:hypothetical protein